LPEINLWNLLHILDHSNAGETRFTSDNNEVILEVYDRVRFVF
jgi:hypothetical protein